MKFNLTKSSETFFLNPPIQIKGDWMIGLTSLEIYNSIFNITEQNNNFEFYNFPDSKNGGVSYDKVRDEIETDFDISEITATNLQDEKIGPIIIEEYREQVSKRMKNDEYLRILAIYNSSIFQDFESFHRTEVDLVQDDIRLVLDEYNSKFITSELERGIYTFKDISEAFLRILQPEHEGFLNAIDIELDDITMKTKMVVRTRTGIIAIKN